MHRGMAADASVLWTIAVFVWNHGVSGDVMMAAEASSLSALSYFLWGLFTRVVRLSS